MKSFMSVFFLLIIITFNIRSQVGCDPSLNSNIPPSPYLDGYLTFDGKGDFLRTDDLAALEFPSNSTDSFSIACRLKVSSPFKPMFIFGKRQSAGWTIGYHNNEYGYLSIYINNEWKRIYYLGIDTSWHSYRVCYSKADQKLETYVDEELTNTYSNFVYSAMADNSAFSVGNVGFSANYGPQTVNLNSYWFKGSISFLKISANQNIIVNYGFNEGGGQVARDSAGYYYSDRSYPGISTCGKTHFMLGFMPSADTCDPSWSAFDAPILSKFSPLGSGTQYLYSNSGTEYFSEHFSIGMTTWNGYLINAGYFNLAGGNPANFIAKWDGNEWSPLGTGLNHEATGLATYRNELYAVGFFDTAGGIHAKYIAKWNGNSWNTLGSGTGLNNIANVMCVYNDNLIVGGWFTGADGETAAGVASWDGSRWRSMNIGMNGPVYALKVYNGELYAGGNFVSAGTQTCNGIAKWDGNNWNSVGLGAAGSDKTIYTLEVYNGNLYAGGIFIKMNNLFCYNIAKYDGTSWSALGSGATGANCFVSRGYVTSLKVCSNELYAAGLFTKMNGIIANKLAKLNGVDWCSVEYGVDQRPRSMEIYNDQLIINGDFYSASGVACNNIVSYTPQKILTGTGNNIIPVKFSLEQNYPNPFNPKTKITFKIAEYGFVSLKVYDLTGKQLAVLVEKEMQPGTYNSDFDGLSFSSGVYLYRLESTGRDGDKLVASKKMVLIK